MSRTYYQTAPMPAVVRETYIFAVARDTDKAQCYIARHTS